MVSREQVWRVRPTNWRSSRAEAKQKTTLLKRMVRRPGMGLGVLVVLHVAQALHIVCHARAASGARARAARRARRSIGGRKRTAGGRILRLENLWLLRVRHTRQTVRVRMH